MITIIKCKCNFNTIKFRMTELIGSSTYWSLFTMFLHSGTCQCVYFLLGAISYTEHNLQVFVQHQ